MNLDSIRVTAVLNRESPTLSVLARLLKISASYLGIALAGSMILNLLAKAHQSNSLTLGICAVASVLVFLLARHLRIHAILAPHSSIGLFLRSVAGWRILRSLLTIAILAFGLFLVRDVFSDATLKWINILSLAITVLASWTVVQMVRTIGKDRLSTERIQNPIEIYHHIHQAVQFLEGLRGRDGFDKRGEREFSRVLRGLQKSEDYLEHYLDFVSDLRLSGENAFLSAGRHFRSRGDAVRAALHYEKALDYHMAYRQMSKEELEECVAELQVCYLATFNVEGLYRLEQQVKQTLRVSIEQVEPGISFRLQCLREWLFMRLKAMRFFRRWRWHFPAEHAVDRTGNPS